MFLALWIDISYSKDEYIASRLWSNFYLLLLLLVWENKKTELETLCVIQIMDLLIVLSLVYVCATRRELLNKKKKMICKIHSYIGWIDGWNMENNIYIHWIYNLTFFFVSFHSFYSSLWNWCQNFFFHMAAHNHQLPMGLLLLLLWSPDSRNFEFIIIII